MNTLTTPALVQPCQGCALMIQDMDIPKHHDAYCPRCGTRLYHAGHTSLSYRNALLISCLMLFIPAYCLDFLNIRLLGMDIHGAFFTVVQTLFDADDIFVALLVLFHGALAPIGVCVLLAIIHIAIWREKPRLFQTAYTAFRYLKPWAMVDVFLISLAIVCFKLRDYASLNAGLGLYALIAVQFIFLLLMHQSHFYHQRSRWQTINNRISVNDKAQHLRTVWSLLLTAMVCLVPANVLPISIFYANHQQIQDTIFSGTLRLSTSSSTSLP